MILTVLGWVASAAIIGTYFGWTVLGKPARWFHAANALGGLPLLAGEIALAAWQIMPITVVFTVVGWIGWLEREEKPEPRTYGPITAGPFEGIDIILDPLVPPNQAYLLNSRYLMMDPSTLDEIQAVFNPPVHQGTPSPPPEPPDPSTVEGMMTLVFPPNFLGRDD